MPRRWLTPLLGTLLWVLLAAGPGFCIFQFHDADNIVTSVLSHPPLCPSSGLSYTFLLDPVAPDRHPVGLPSCDPQVCHLSSVCFTPWMNSGSAAAPPVFLLLTPTLWTAPSRTPALSLPLSLRVHALNARWHASRCPKDALCGCPL